MLSTWLKSEIINNRWDKSSMFYISICIFLILGYLAGKQNKHLDSKLYFFSILLLTVILMIRYGQGTDYFGYRYLFMGWNGTLEEAIRNPYGYHGEIGFRILCWMFHGNYELFIGCLSVVEMWMLHKFIKKYAPCRMGALAFFFPTCYYIYYFSALRQGLVLALFLGLLFPLLIRKKYKEFCLGVCFLATIHSAALILLVLPIVLRLPFKKIYLILAIASIVGPLMDSVLNLSGALGLNTPEVGAINFDANVSIVALAARLMLLACFIYFRTQIGYKITNWETIVEQKIYLCGFIIYLFFLKSPTAASRFMMFFSAMDMVVFPAFLKLKSYYRPLVTILLLSLLMVYTVKNNDANIYQGRYKPEVDIFSYPYITIFNKEDLWDYRYTYPPYTDENPF